MPEDRVSRQVRAGSRTYFLDLEKTKDKGISYLKITESRFKGDGAERERSSIVIFPEGASEFAKLITELVAQLK